MWFKSYYTTYVLSSMLYLLLNRHHTSSLILLSNIGMIGGWYITYVSPRFLYVPYFQIYMDGTALRVVDFMTHTAPCLYVYYRLWDQKVRWDNRYFYRITLLYLLMWNDIFELYFLSLAELFYILFLSFFCTLAYYHCVANNND
jgi:hypothetical protein